MMDHPEHREVLGQWLNDHNFLLDGAEIGVLSGVFSRNILSQWKGKNLFMVDPLIQQPVDVYREDDGRFNYAVSRKLCRELTHEDHRAILMLELSSDASRKFGTGSLDFVYIDANHSYEFVIQDMDLWWPKVKPGGLFGGHDYYNSTVPPYFNEVERAVLDWSKNMGIPFEVSKKCSSWWMRK